MVQLRLGKRGLPVLGENDMVACLLEYLPEQDAHIVAIIDDQNVPLPFSGYSLVHKALLLSQC